MKEKINQLMKSLGCTEEEAIQIIKDDEDIDKGLAKDFDLSKEQEKASKKYRSTNQRKKSNKPIKRERKPNKFKQFIIRELVKTLERLELIEIEAESIQIKNYEREISFTNMNGDSFSLTLVQHRKKK